MEFLRQGSAQAALDESAAALVEALLEQLRQRGPLRRVLLLPPDVTRLHSGAGLLTVLLHERLEGCEVAILPTTGTHAPLSDAERQRMFPSVPPQLFHVHDWRRGVVPLGEVPADFGRGFELTKADGTLYHVCLDGLASHCCCKGHSKHGHCKHVDSLAALEAAGRL